MLLDLLNWLVDLLPIAMAIAAFWMVAKSRLAGAGATAMRRGALVFAAAAIVSFVFNAGWQLVRAIGLGEYWGFRFGFSLMSVISASILPVIGMLLVFKAATLAAAGPRVEPAAAGGGRPPTQTVSAAALPTPAPSTPASSMAYPPAYPSVYPPAPTHPVPPPAAGPLPPAY
jgi:hypothetical protein